MTLTSFEKLEIINTMPIVDEDGDGECLYYATVARNEENLAKLAQIVPDVEAYLKATSNLVEDVEDKEFDISTAAFEFTPAKFLHNKKFVIDIDGYSDCDWCGENTNKLSYPHNFDYVPGARICESCWNHDREVYKGSYGEDIGEFKAI